MKSADSDETATERLDAIDKSLTKLGDQVSSASKKSSKANTSATEAKSLVKFHNLFLTKNWHF